jgi:hypothetical protein
VIVPADTQGITVIKTWDHLGLRCRVHPPQDDSALIAAGRRTLVPR